MAFGYHGAVLHIDLTTQTMRVEYPTETFYRIYGGGGLLGTYYLLQHTSPGIDALGSENVLVFSNSVVAGYPAAGLVRYVVTTKSPLSGGIGETRSEGPWAVALKQSGYDALVIHGQAEQPVQLVIENGVPRIAPATELWGKTIGETNDALAEYHDRHVEVAAIGPAGEQLVRYASIVSSRTHQAQRHGVGAVMGAKRLKAIVLIGGTLPPVAHPDRLAAVNTRFATDMKQNVLSMWQKDLPGFAVWVHTHGLDAALNTENYRTASFAHLENYKATTWMPFFQRTAKCPGCVNDCIKIYHNHDADLDMRAGGMHQEVSGTMGPNIGTQHPRTVMRYNNLCNQYGLDPVSLGFTLSFAMEAHAQGVLNPTQMDGIDLAFGNSEATLAMIERIVRRTGFGAVLAEGAERAAARIGNGAERYAMHVKGVELVPFEPRTQSNLALGYATAPIGPRYDICEHDWDFDTTVGWEHSLDYARTLGIVERVPMEYVGPEKVRNYKALQTLWSGADALGFCIFAIAPTRVLSLQLMTDMVAAITGWETSSYELIRFGERRMHLMQVYNRREGLTAAQDTLPDRFFDEGIDSGDKAGVKLDRAAFMAEIALYYEMMGWDENGTPRPATLYEHHLEWAIPALPARVQPNPTMRATAGAVSPPVPAAATAPAVTTARVKVATVPTPKPVVARELTTSSQPVYAKESRSAQPQPSEVAEAAETPAKQSPGVTPPPAAATPTPVAAPPSSTESPAAAVPPVNAAAVSEPVPAMPVADAPPVAGVTGEELLTTLLDDTRSAATVVPPVQTLYDDQSLAADRTPTADLSPELLDQLLMADSTPRPSVAQPAALDTPLPDAAPVQPHTQLPPPAIKQHQPRPLGIPAPANENVPQPVHTPAPAEVPSTTTPAPTPPTVSPEPAKTGQTPRSIAKRLSIEELLSAEIPPRREE